jgi:hypothetical protein
MVEQTTRYGIGTTVDLEYSRAVERTREELAREGFGVLAEIGIATTLKKKLDADFRPYVILGACNAPGAHGRARPGAPASVQRGGLRGGRARQERGGRDGSGGGAGADRQP